MTFKSFEEIFNGWSEERRRCGRDRCVGVRVAIPEQEQKSLSNVRCPVCGAENFVSITRPFKVVMAAGGGFSGDFSGDFSVTAPDWVDRDPIFREMRRKVAGPPCCADCRHWDRSWPPESYVGVDRRAWGRCRGVGALPVEAATFDIEGHEPDDEGRGGDTGDLVTAPTFGCVAFERKERP